MVDDGLVGLMERYAEMFDGELILTVLPADKEEAALLRRVIETGDSSVMLRRFTPGAWC